MFLGIIPIEQHIFRPRLTGTKNPLSETENYTYDAGSRRTSYTMNGGNSIRYDYDALNDLVEKTYQDENGEVQDAIGNTVSEENPSGVLYGYDLLGQRISMMDTSGDSVYTYDGLGRITSVTTYRKPAEAGADTADREDGETIRYEYDGCDQLAAIVYADGTRVSYAYDKNDNLTAVTDRNGKTTTYVYDAINRVTEIHRPNGVSTYNTYNARDQIVSLKNTCDECGWVVSQYDYTYDDNGYIATEKAVESLYDYAWDDKHNGRHEDGRHDDKMPHGTKHNGKHDKDSEYRFQLVETDREFTYDENGRLLSSKEQEENSGLTTYDYTYDKVGNRLSYVKRTQTTKHPNKTDVAESAFYQYNDSNQLVSAKLFDGKKNTTVDYTYDENGNLISEIGEYGVEQVETYYDYTVENRLQAVYDADRLLMAAAYDGDGNRVFQLNYNLHTDEDWKDNSGNGNGNNKDNTGSGNNGNGNSSSGNNGNSGNGNGNSGDNGNGNNNSGNNGNGNGNSENNGNDKENSKSEGTDDAGYGNATNAEEHNSQNQSGILFPAAEEISRTETDLIAMIKTTGKEKDYELIEYILNVNTQYTQVLMELNENGAMDAVYTYGVSRLTEDRFTGESNFYLYDPSGNVAGITDQNGYLWQSYRYDAFGNATFGSPQYDNEYTFNAESYNPNIQSQYLRSRYYDTVKGNFLTEDSYLGDIRNPLTLNRYSYCIGNPLFYSDPSGHAPQNVIDQVVIDFLEDTKNSRLHDYDLYEAYNARLEFYDILDQEGIWDRMGHSTEEQRISYMTDYNFGKSGRNVKKWVEEAKLVAETEECKPDTPLYKYTEKNVDSIVALNPKFDAERDNFRIAYEKNIERYKELAEETGVPPELIAIIHYRENSGDYLNGSFNVYLHNGEQLGNVTVKEPKNIIFYDFNLAAIDAINKKKDYKEKYYLTSDSKDIVAMMCFAEVYNGLGYYNNGHISPYLYSGTNVYISGKYVEEKNAAGEYISVYKEDVVDEQIGVYILLNSILN